MKPNKLFRRALLCLLCALCAAAIPAAAIPAAAAPVEEIPAEAPARTLTIATVEDFLAFVENCRLDSYSMGLTVTLEADLSLKDVAVESIPIFCGTFEGGGHNITGLRISKNGSVQGLFRYVTAGAVIRDLTVQGEIAAVGSASTLGGIAGENAGQIENCRFVGKVTGSDYVGGIAGINTVTGLIEGCRTTGSLKGSHFAGGIAGENNGVIRSCTNAAGLNTTAQQNTVAMQDISLDTLTNTESAGAVTDIGGIAGTSSGVIRDCTNHGNVGYQHMSYNVGGIAGSQSGYLADCVNHGRIQGRKEVGGIVGQLEPALRIQYDTDALQLLSSQLSTLSIEADRAAQEAEGGANSLRGQLQTLRDQANSAADAAGQLLPSVDPDNPQPPDEDALLALQNALAGSMTQLGQTVNGIAGTTQNTAASLFDRLEKIGEQLEAIDTTVSRADELLGGSFTDVSDEDTAADITAKVIGCTNHGELSADRNIGGITGAIAPENDLDPEDDYLVNGEYSLNFSGELRAVILNSTNCAALTCKYQNAGGIAGMQTMGLIKDCLNSGDLIADAATGAGGIAGISRGFIRACSARCTVAASDRTGGIAGSGAVVTDCRAMTRLTGSDEYTGSILGMRTEAPQTIGEPLRSNYYTLTEARDFGAVDGVSYAGKAEPLPLEDFLALEGLAPVFRHAVVRFVFADGSTVQVKLTPGDPLTEADIPALPKLTGADGRWQAAEGMDFSRILFDTQITAVYDNYNAVVQGDVLYSGKPLILLLGKFDANAAVETAPGADCPPLAEKEAVIDMWDIALTNAEGLHTGRLLLPKDAASARLRLALRREGAWSDAAFTVDGSYLVFAMDTAVDGAALVQLAPFPWQQAAAAGALALVVILLPTVLVIRTSKRRKAKKKTGTA